MSSKYLLVASFPWGLQHRGHPQDHRHSKDFISKVKSRDYGYPGALEEAFCLALSSSSGLEPPPTVAIIASSPDNQSQALILTMVPTTL